MAGYLGNIPTAVPLSSADLADGIITSAKIADGTIVNADINASAAIVSTKLSGVQGKFESALLHVRDEKSNGTDGGSATANTWVKRDLNTILTNEISGASITSSVITLPSGTYFIQGSAPARQQHYAKLKLRNTTDSSDTLIGTNEYVAASVGAITHSFIAGRFTIASQKDFELQMRVSDTSVGGGFGLSNSMSVVEVYTDIQIWKTA